MARWCDGLQIWRYDGVVRWAHLLSSTFWVQNFFKLITCDLSLVWPFFFMVQSFERGLRKSCQQVCNKLSPFYHIQQAVVAVLIRSFAFVVLDLVQSATFFREAAGVYHHLANEVLPSLGPALPAERPPEAFSSVSTVMSLICLAEAQVSDLGVTQCMLVGLFKRAIY